MWGFPQQRSQTPDIACQTPNIACQTPIFLCQTPNKSCQTPNISCQTPKIPYQFFQNFGALSQQLGPRSQQSGALGEHRGAPPLRSAGPNAGFASVRAISPLCVELISPNPCQNSQQWMRSHMLHSSPLAGWQPEVVNIISLTACQSRNIGFGRLAVSSALSSGWSL